MIWLLGCSDPPLPLDAPSLDDRWAAFLALDADGLRAEAPALTRRMSEEPDLALRREIVRQIGAAGDPKVRAALVPLLDTELGDVAAESLSFDRPQGCEILAERWVHGVAAAPETFVADAPGRSLRRIFEEVSPECRPALRAVMPDVVAQMDGEPEHDAQRWAEDHPTDPVVPARDAVDVRGAAGVWAEVSGTWVAASSGLRLADGTALWVRAAPAPSFGEGEAVRVVGIPIPVAPPGDPDPRGRMVEVRVLAAR